MSDDFGDKTEDPTPRKRREARERGKVARGRDVGTAVLVIASMVLLNNFGPGVVGALKVLADDMLGPASMADASAAAAVVATSRAAVAVGAALAPLLVGMVLAAVLAEVVQVGFVFNGNGLQPNPGAANPLKGLGRLFGDGKSPVQAAISLAKLLLVGFVACSAVHDRLPQILAAPQLELIQIFGLGAAVVYSVGLRVGVVLLLLALVDYAYQRHRLEQELRMTKQEVKDEMRRMDGDPEIKRRRRQLAMQMMKEQLKRDVPTADVVVTDPTRFAVALKYDAAAMHAPRVVAKGQDHLGLRIREIAIASGVPIVEREPLARALYRLAEIGGAIPEQYYSAVAEILAYVYELNGSMRRRVAG